ncbi:Pro-neuregulin-1, membrane-bound isoform [Varanus komodoensis]|nr:Pro-neuregulin-1, membrane-bound isoform [Varanus komodoensis]
MEEAVNSLLIKFADDTKTGAVTTTEEQSLTLFLSLAVPPKLKEMKSQESAVGQTLVLRCEASSEHSSLKFKWLKNGKEITKRNRPENIKIKSPKKQNLKVEADKTFSELRISRASLTDAGEYTCKASNRFGNNSTKAQIIITDINESTGMIPVLTKGANTFSQLVDKIPASTEGMNTSSCKYTILAAFVDPYHTFFLVP